MSDDGPDEPFDTNVPTPASRVGGRVVRPAGPWTPTTHALLRHLREVGFTACPQVVGDGFDEHGQEILTWVEGEVVHPEPFPDAEDSLFEIGRLLRQLHHATATFVPPPDATWMPWSMHRDEPGTIISHANVAPWHVVVRDGRPVAFIGWEYAGPVVRLEELAATGRLKSTLTVAFVAAVMV
jgi:aminoglycoside phosphotransferase (APT) family kinase protein